MTLQSAPAGAEPLVSVIIIFFNARRFMAEAIESVQSQTISSWEIVLVDDGSSDGSREVALEYAARDPQRIRLVAHPGRQNRGTGASRNLGMDTARGRYLTFLDADDVYEPHRLERTVELLEADPDLGVVISHELYWRRWEPAGATGQNLARRPDDVVGPSAVFNQVIPPPVLIASTLATPEAAMPGICSITFRRQSVLELGGIPPQFATQYEDQAIIVKLLLNCSAMVIEDCLARYRQHDESLTHRARETGEYRPGMPHPEREQFISWVAEYADSLGIDEPVLAQALNDELAARRRPLRTALHLARRKLRRGVLLAANAVLPERAVDRLIEWYLARQNASAARTAARHAESMARSATPSRKD